MNSHKTFGISEICVISSTMDEASTIVYYSQVLTYMDVASVAILVFDYALTFDLEVSLVWRSKWSLPKVLFLLSRYSTVLDLPWVLYFGMTPVVSVERCSQLNEVISWGTVFGISVAEAILVVRTYALSGSKRSVLIAFVSLWVASVSATIVFVALFVKSSIFKPSPFPGSSGCFLAVLNKVDVVLPFVIVLMYDTVIMVYTVYLGIKKYRYSARTPLLVTLYRDGITYYVFLLVSSLLNLSMLLINGTSPSKQPIAQLFNTFVRVMHSVLSTRIILHLRDANRKQLESESQLPSSDGGIRFKAQTVETDA
ncbi:hypothetical protein C8R45DRAFT_582864 [Mycena sanguinolenta]|nr:hypothetical protein C8R45DRAFT_582864 [Mycena sanguinolenta]